MYSDIDNLIINVARFVFSFTLIFVLWPRVLFKVRGEGGLDGFISRYVKMVCLCIAVGYILVFIKLYELISLVAILLMLWAYRKLLIGDWRSNLAGFITNTHLYVYDFFDGLVNPVQMIAERCKETTRSLKRSVFDRFSNITVVGNTLLFAGVLIYSAYLRFYDAVRHAAPAMSDAYVTLAWMKYIERRELFHDGIYPQGFHIYLSILHKFAANDPLYVLKYTGPLNGVLITLGIYFFVSRFTGRKTPGVVSAFVFGVLGSLPPLASEWERQASTNSQEFALVFLLPAWYYASDYIRNLRKTSFWAAFASFTVIGWVHTLVFVFLGYGLFVLLVSHLLLKFKESLKPAWKISMAGIAAGVLSVLPALAGLLMGRHFHGSSADFITSELKVPYPEIAVLDEIALAGFLLFIIVSVITKKSKRDLVVETFILLLGMSSFILYMTLGPLTSNAVLASRINILWSLLACVGVGVGWYALSLLVREFKKKQIVETALCLVAIVFIVIWLRPSPAQPYKMQYDSLVEQYLRISGQFTPTEWMIVSAEEGYALALGRGFHLMLGDFLSWYNPGERRLARKVDGQVDVLITPDIFIFKEKNLFRVDMKVMEPILARRDKEYEMLDLWLDEYGKTHDNMSVFYEDPDVQVIRIHQPKSRDEAFKDIWGSERE